MLVKLNGGCYPVFANKLKGCPVPEDETGRYTFKSKFDCKVPVVSIAPHSQEWLCHENRAGRGKCKNKFNGTLLKAAATNSKQRQRLAV